MSNTIKWATYENRDATKTLKQHAFMGVTRKARFTQTPYNVARSLCGNVMVGEGDTLAETASIDQIDDEVMKPDTACKSCLKRFNSLNSTTNDKG